jgi:protein pelota
MHVNGRTRVEGGRERVTLVPESLDDLWHLTYLIEPGDLVSGDTTRRIQRADDHTRDTGGQREPMRVTLAVEESDFDKFANRLRASGVIDWASREDQIGAHHTLNVEEHTEIDIEKHWKPDQENRLAEAIEASDAPDVAIVTVEEGAAAVHTVAQYGTEERVSLTGPTGKGEFARDRSELFAELASVISHLDCDAILLAGPGFTKQDAMKYFEREHPAVAAEITTTVDTSAIGDRGVHEVLKRGAVEEVQAETRIAEEAEHIDELTERIAREEPATYGIEAVAQAAEFGAIERLLILDERLRTERGTRETGEWELDVNTIIENTEHQGGAVTVFSSDFAPGGQLESLGGIAALLRYRLS